MSLTINDLGKVYKVTFKARFVWRNISLELGLSPVTNRKISANFKEEPRDCYREVLSEWLEGGERSWQDLLEALSSPTVEHAGLAEEVRREHVAETPQSLVGRGPQHMPPPSDHVYRQPIAGELVIDTKKQLGYGAFGTVFEGSYLGKPCAVKVLHHVAMEMRMNLPVGQPGEKESQFDRECEFLKSFQHLNIVKHLSTEKHTSGNDILVLELMDCSLKIHFSKQFEQPLCFDHQLSLSMDVASGLSYIHSKGIIHRDLCGDNVLLKLTQDSLPIAKISDFGMSCLLDPSKLSLTAMRHRMGYLPPEASREEEEHAQYDFSLDVFSLGAIMLQIIHQLETVKSSKHRSTILAQTPDTHLLKLVTIRCLHEDMQNRPSASQVCNELKSIKEAADRPSNAEGLEAIGTPTKQKPRHPSGSGGQDLNGKDRCDGSFTTMEVQLERNAFGFGLGIVGGAEEGTQVAVSGIATSSPAHLDGRLQIGDEIIRINGTSVVNASHRKVLKIMRAATTVVLRIHRPLPIPAENVCPPVLNVASHSPPDMNENVRNNLSQLGAGGRNVTIERPNVQTGFGLRLQSDSECAGTVICEIVPNSPAAKCNQLFVNDKLLAVNGRDVSKMEHNDLVALIKSSGTRIYLTVQQSGTMVNGQQSGTMVNAQQSGTMVNGQHLSNQQSSDGQQESPHLEPRGGQENYQCHQSQDTCKPTRSQSDASDSVEMNPDDYCIDIRRNGRAGFGFSVTGGADYGSVLTVQRISEGGAAHIDGRLRVGDELLMINGKRAAHMRHLDAINVIRIGGDVVQLVVYRPN